MTPADCTLVIVTKGDRDLWSMAREIRKKTGIYVHIAIGGPQEMVYARWRAASCFSGSVVCVQDDDTIVEWPALIACYQPGKLVCNMPKKWRPHYQTTGGICLVGFGAIFDRALLDDAFGPYDRAGFERDEVFLRECDRVFTFLNRHRTVWADVPITQLPCSFDADRMWKETRHEADYQEIRRRLALIK